MPSKLSEKPEETLRDYLETNLRPAEIEGYTPNQTWTVDSPPDDALPIVTDWSDRGDYYPIIVVNETEGPQVPGSGSTNANGMGPNGTNQYTVRNVTIACEAVEGEGYLNGVEAEALADALYSEVRAVLQQDTDAVPEGVWTGVPTPPTYSTEDGGDSTERWHQCQGTVPVGVLNTP